MACNSETGCTAMQVMKEHEKGQDLRISAVEQGVSSVHRRVDGLLILMITTLASSLAAAVLAYINFAAQHATK
jgi:hypothetical protein